MGLKAARAARARARHRGERRRRQQRHRRALHQGRQGLVAGDERVVGGRARRRVRGPRGGVQRHRARRARRSTCRGDRACVEWVATATHSGPLVVDDDLVIEPTGVRCSLRGVTVAEFDGDRIRSFRQYWDEVSLIAQLGLLPED